MGLAIRDWSAVLLSGPSPKLIVEGQIRTHPYAFASLARRDVVGGPVGTMYLDLRVVGDQPALDVLHWKRVRFEHALRAAECDTVVIGGTGSPVRLIVRRQAAHSYARIGALGGWEPGLA